MTDSTQEMFERVGAGFLPPAANSQIVRLLNGEDVKAYVVKDTHDLASSEGLSIHRRLAVLTPTRLVHVSWAESVDGSDDEDEDDEAATFDRLAQELSGTYVEAPDPVLEIATRTVRLSQIVDVDINTRYEQDSIDPISINVIILLPTLNAFVTTPLECADEECAGFHGSRGQAMQDAFLFSMTIEEFSREDIEALSMFAEAVANSLP